MGLGTLADRQGLTALLGFASWRFIKLQSRPFGRLILVLIILGAAGCREDGLVGPEEELAPFVGT